MTLPNHDSLGRRRRDVAVPSGESVHITPRDLVWFEMLHRHGALPLPYLYEFTKATNRSHRSAVIRATKLFHEQQLLRPHQQFATLDARYQTLVYDLAEKAKMELKAASLWRSRAPQPSPTHWRHDLMLSCFTASIHLATIGTECRYIFQDEILDRANTNMWFDVGYKIGAKNILLRPDRLFGIQYPNGKVRLFIVEADCGTETLQSTTHRKTIERNAKQYQAFIAGKLYKDALKVQGGLLLINLTNSADRMTNMMKVVESAASQGRNAYTLFGCLPQFARYFKPPKVMTQLFTDPWPRVGCDPFQIHVI